MPRPIKQGLDYFPMDVEIDEKIELIEAKHGIVGFAVIVKLFQRIYKEGYYMTYSEDVLLLFSKRINVDINKVIDIINDCLRYQIFDEKLKNDYNILTSSGIQKRFLVAVGRRKTLNLNKNYIIVDINWINVDINWINDDRSTQSKGKESKGKESKEILPKNSFLDRAKIFYNSELQKTKDENYKIFVEFLFGNNHTKKPFPKVLKLENQLSYESFCQLMAKCSDAKIKFLDMVLELENYKDTDKKYKDLYLTMNNWIKRRINGSNNR